MTSRRDHLLLAVWAAMIFLLSLFLSTRGNDFPFHRHPDEPGKVAQVQTAKWNFNHPMLLLTTSRIAVKLTGAHTEQEIVRAGRTVSALFIASATAALIVLAWMWGGWGAALIAGPALLFHHQLFELAHYMKEDPALLLGIACTFGAAQAYWWKPNPSRAALVGIGCALAFSGKYLGALALPVAAAVMALAPGRTRAHWLTATLAMLGGLLLINLPMLSDGKTLFSSFNRELELASEGQGATRSVPHAQYWSIFLDNSTPVAWLCLLAFLVARVRDTRLRQHWREHLPQLLIWAWPFAYAVALSFSPKSNDRYFLPASALLTVLAALGAGDLARWLSRWMNRRLALALIGCALVAAQFPTFSASRPGWLEYRRALAQDDIAELVRYLETNVPPAGIIAHESRTGLPQPGRASHANWTGQLPQRRLYAKSVADLGTLDELRAKGVTHVVVSEGDYGRYFLTSLKPKKGGEAEYDRRRTFYQRLFAEAEPVWESKRGAVVYLHPGLRVYQLAH